jgi:hypothetical protein
MSCFSLSCVNATLYAQLIIGVYMQRWHLIYSAVLFLLVEDIFDSFFFLSHPGQTEEKQSEK